MCILISLCYRKWKNYRPKANWARRSSGHWKKTSLAKYEILSLLATAHPLMKHLQIMLASWRGTRFEVTQVLRNVVDRVLKEPGVSDPILYNRAKVRHTASTVYCDL